MILDKAKQLKEDGALNPHPEKVKSELFRSGVFFDPQDLLQVKYEMLRYVLDGNHSVTEASQMFGLSRVAYYKALEKFKKHGISGLIPHKRGPKSAHKLTSEIGDFIEGRRDTESSLPSWAVLSKLIEGNFQLSLTRAVSSATTRKKKEWTYEVQ